MDCPLPEIREVRMHLAADPAFTAKGWGRKVKAIGGRFEAARGQTETRYVYVPATATGYALAADLIAHFPKGRSTAIVLQVNMTEDWSTFTASSGVRVYNIPTEHHVSHGPHTPNPAAVALQLDKVLRGFFASAQTWWAATGARAAEERRAHKEATHQARLNRWPAEIAAEVRRALAEGVPEGLIRAAIHDVLHREARS